MGELERLRSEIDNIDRELVKLFEKRMEVALRIAEYKRESDTPIFNEGRENEVVRRNLQYLKNKDFENETKEFFNSIFAISRGIQLKYLSNYRDIKNDVTKNIIEKPLNKELNIGFQGVPGSFSEEALFEHFNEKVNTYSYEGFEDVFKALTEKKIDYAVVPIENSSTGSITEVYDLLGRYGLYIIGERCIRVEHNLIGIKGTQIDDIKEVYSHSQGFRQSSEFFKDYPDWKLIPYYNTATSAELIKNLGDKSKAAVASKRAAEIYGLEIIKPKLNFNSDNYTRFAVIGNNLELSRECNKISLVLTLPHSTGSLHSVLKLFAENNLNLLKIESRPIINKSWEYFFYIDFEGNLKDEAVKRIISLIEMKSTYFKLLGNYPGFEA